MTWLAAQAFLRGLWAFLRSPLGSVLALALVAVLGLSLADARGYRRGASGVQAKWDKRAVADAENARAIEAKHATAGAKIEGDAKAAAVEIRWRTKTLIERIPADVPPSPPGWSLPVGFVRHHIEATSQLPVTGHAAQLPNDAPTGLGLDDLARVDDENAGRCLAEIDRFSRLQEWVRETR